MGETLESWGLAFDSPRKINYHDGMLYSPDGQAFQAQLKPWLDRIDVSLRQQYGEDDLKLSLFEEKIHKAQFDYFLGHPGEEFDDTAEKLEENFQEYWEKIETEMEGGFTGSARERTIENVQDMQIAALPEIGVNYDEVLEEAQESPLYRVAKPRVLRKTMKQKIDENEGELLDVAEPLVEGMERYRDIYHINPVAEAFTDIAESHLTGSVGSKLRKWHQRHRSGKYPRGTDSELYSTLVEEYQEFDGTPEEKISHVMGLMPQYLEEQYENGELPEQRQHQEFEIL
ncbi:MAG: hypothetical protein ABEJ36_04865 [Candidatus Nanosalina sp.]